MIMFEALNNKVLSFNILLCWCLGCIIPKTPPKEQAGCTGMTGPAAVDDNVGCAGKKIGEKGDDP